ncbi:MAG: alpha-1,2-fucosyltransferase [Bacteroidia bacterium]
MIIVRLEGGLGNQMFQYALGRHLSIINKTELKFDLSSYEEKLFNNGAKCRGYNLDIFDLNIKIASADEIQKVKASEIPFFETLKYKFQRLKTIPYFRKTELFESKLFFFDSNILKAGKNSYLTGYWQSPKYFDSIRKNLLEDFKFKELPSKKDYDFIDAIIKQESVSIHIRRGDYVTNPETYKLHGVCTIDYYKQAIEHICKNVENPFFYIFSDDIDWAKENIKPEENVTYVKGTPSDKDYFEMHLMSLCKHNIIANSSFSWWAAWLNSNSQKIIIAPQKWMNMPDLNVNDLLPEIWKKI